MRTHSLLWLMGSLPAVTVAAAVWRHAGSPLTEVFVAAACLALAIYLRPRLSEPASRITDAARRLAATVGSPQPGPSPADLPALPSLLSPLVDSVIHALQAARNEQRHAEAIFARMADGIVVVDSELRVQRINPAGCELLSLPAERAVGRTVIEATMHYGLDALFRDALATGQTRSRQLEVLQPHRRVLRALVTPMRGTSPAVGAVAVIQDLTDLDRIERVRRDFVTNVSHELRTPVASIRVMAESLQRGALEQPELAGQFLQSITEAADRLGTLVDDLLTLARIEAGTVRQAWQAVDLAGLAAEATAALRPLAQQHGVALAADPLEPLRVTGDAEGLRQALANMVTNGIKYNQPGGQVRVSVRRAPGGACVEVTDTGIGIAAEHLPRIFERFYRVDRGRSRAMGGTGLGLAIVKHVAEAHGGHVTVQSTPGAGSAFLFTLPEAPADALPTRTDQ